MSIKSTTCFNKKNGKPLTEYYNESDAQEGADHANDLRNFNLEPYKCDNCGLWHLSPKNRQTPSTKCSTCKDRNGYFKDLYHSEGSAQRRAEILFKEQGVRLSVYECPNENGWHLTKG